ncbi:MAG TPA: hypothetical protein VHW47_06880, partial [Acidimicrobiales bacterium]|nr:hypothetical protein [Acidimicrobiales bacterium]
MRDRRGLPRLRTAGAFPVAVALSASILVWVGAVLGGAGPAGAATTTTAAAGTGTGGGSEAAAPLRPRSATGIAGWHLVGRYTQSVLTADEGVATVDRVNPKDKPTGGQTLLYRGFTVIPADLK